MDSVGPDLDFIGLYPYRERTRWVRSVATQALGIAALLVAPLGCDSGSNHANRESVDAAHLPQQLLETGQKLESLDSLVEALRCYDSCVALAGPSNADAKVLVAGLLSRARLHLKLDLYSRAESDTRAALDLTEAGNMPALRATVWLTLAKSLEREHRLAAADSASDSALSQASSLGPLDSMLVAEALVARGRTLVQLYRAAQAESLFSAAVEALPGDAPAEQRLEAQSLLGWSMAQQGRLEEAELVLLRAYSGLSGTLGAEDQLVREAAGRLAELYERWQKPDLFAHYQSLATHRDSTEAAE